MSLTDEQTASTDNFFNTLGHGSAPKLLLDMVTIQLSLPMQFCRVHGTSIKALEKVFLLVTGSGIKVKQDENEI